MIRTRFAPSPTGFLHIGGARTALYSWAFAKHHQGTFILRIEDTDLERSTPEAVQGILDGMNWLSLTPDEGPFYQMQRMARYQSALQKMLADGTAYYCYTSPEELDHMREDQRARGLKPRYDGTWRPEAGKKLPEIPEGRQPLCALKILPKVLWFGMILSKGALKLPMPSSMTSLLRVPTVPPHITFVS